MHVMLIYTQMMWDIKILESASGIQTDILSSFNMQEI